MVIDTDALEEITQEEYERGVRHGIQLGILLMKHKLLLACENGTPIEINGRVYFVKTDIDNLRAIFDDMENAADDEFY